MAYLVPKLTGKLHSELHSFCYCLLSHAEQNIMHPLDTHISLEVVSTVAIITSHSQRGER
jgi:hypothetical protein